MEKNNKLTKRDRVGMIIAVVVVLIASVVYLIGKYAPTHADYVSIENHSFDGIDRHLVVLYDDAKIKKLGYIPGVVNSTENYYVIKTNRKDGIKTQMYVANKDNLHLYKTWQEVFGFKFNKKVVDPTLTHRIDVAKAEDNFEINDGFTTVKPSYAIHMRYLNGHEYDEPTGKHFNDDINNIEKILYAHNIPVSKEGEILESIIFALPNNYNASVKFLQDQMKAEDPQGFSDGVAKATQGPNSEILKEIVDYLNNVPYRYDNKDDFGARGL